MSDDVPGFMAIATSRSVVERSARIALVVGTVLAVINHTDTILSGETTYRTIVKIAVTYLVPYCVSTYSSVGAVRERLQMIER